MSKSTVYFSHVTTLGPNFSNCNPTRDGDEFKTYLKLLAVLLLFICLVLWDLQNYVIQEH